MKTNEKKLETGNLNNNRKNTRGLRFGYCGNW